MTDWTVLEFCQLPEVYVGILSINAFEFLLLQSCNIVFHFQAIDTRDALAKSIYSCLFDWLVEQINKSLAVGKRRTGRSISILDIYGFESFDVCFCDVLCLSSFLLY